MAGKQRYDQLCPLAGALDVVGGRWALLVVRELMLGPRRFTDIHHHLESASTDMVASRLRELEADGIVEKLPDRRYRLTAAGLALAPVMRSLFAWSLRTGFGPTSGGSSGVVVDVGRRLLTMAAVAARTESSTPPSGTYQLGVGEHRAALSGVGDRYFIREGVVEEPDGSMIFTVDAWMNFVFGAMTPGQLADEGGLVMEGEDSSVIVDDIDRILVGVRAEVDDDFYETIALQMV